MMTRMTRQGLSHKRGEYRMASVQQRRSGKRAGKSNLRKERLPLAAHRAFAPLLGVWGAALGAGVVLVLPASLVGRMLQGSLLGTWEHAGQSVLAAVAGGLLGALTFSIGAMRNVGARRLVRGPSVAAMAARSVTPINPARDLGSRRLDDPVERMPFSTPAWRDADLETPRPAAAQAAAPTPAPAPAPVAATAPAPEPAPVPETAPASAPRELDLAEFAELPGRNAVWVEEMPVVDAAPAKPDPVADIRARTLRAVATPPPAPGTAALARLREVPPSQLSLAEMVERFAGALEEVRQIAPTRTLAPTDLAAREAALAEALKALEALSGKGRPAPRLPRRDDPMLALRARLQPQLSGVRGAA